jgi:hypothetical protein
MQTFLSFLLLIFAVKGIVSTVGQGEVRPKM